MNYSNSCTLKSHFLSGIKFEKISSRHNLSTALADRVWFLYNPVGLKPKKSRILSSSTKLICIFLFEQTSSIEPEVEKLGLIKNG